MDPRIAEQYRKAARDLAGCVRFAKAHRVAVPVDAGPMPPEVRAIYEEVFAAEGVDLGRVEFQSIGTPQERAEMFRAAMEAIRRSDEREATADMTVTREQIAEWKRIDDRWQAVNDLDVDPACPSATARYDAFLEMANVAVPALLSERESLLSLLREVEWSGLTAEDLPACPVCHAEAPRSLEHREAHGGHASDCRLHALIR